MQYSEMTTNQLINRLREITGDGGAIEWNEEKYPTTTRSEAQQGFIDQLRKDAQAIERELEGRSGTPRMGRPSHGRSVRLQAAITPELQEWLQAQARNGKSVSDVAFRLLEKQRQSEKE